MSQKAKLISSSFRDPSGFLFYRNGVIYRQINKIYKKHYNQFTKKGLYQELVDRKLLIPHKEVRIRPFFPKESYKIIKPQQIPFISYPYEWCFSQLKNAALTTLKIQKFALNFGMTLKDASSYNIQFMGTKPIFIDTLSFERYIEGRPWVAYKQFCQHFLAPLALMSYKDVRLNKLTRLYIDGIPLDIAEKLLPLKSKLNLSLLLHIHFHAKSQKYFAGKRKNLKKKFSLHSFLALIDSLETIIRKLKWGLKDTEWKNYYEGDSYKSSSFDNKKEIVSVFLDEIKPENVWDMGANTGIFSRIASKKDIFTVSFDSDPACIEINYKLGLKNRATNILPLLIDLTNPSPSIGWANEERDSLQKRGPADTLLALALIHHLAISNNLPFDKIANFFTNICKFLIIEFVPKDDPKVKKLLSTRQDIFFKYTQKNFEKTFGRYFKIKKKEQIKKSKRSLYLMRNKKYEKN